MDPPTKPEVLPTGRIKPSTHLREMAANHTAIADLLKIQAADRCLDDSEKAKRHPHRMAASMLAADAMRYETAGL